VKKRNKKFCYRLPQTDRATLYVSQNIVNTVETSCITNPQQIEVMELEGYSWPICSKQPRLVDCRIGVVNKLDYQHNDDEFCWQRDQLAVAKFSKSGISDKVCRGK